MASIHVPPELKLRAPRLALALDAIAAAEVEGKFSLATIGQTESVMEEIQKFHLSGGITDEAFGGLYMVIKRVQQQALSQLDPQSFSCTSGNFCPPSDDLVRLRTEFYAFKSQLDMHVGSKARTEAQISDLKTRLEWEVDGLKSKVAKAGSTNGSTKSVEMSDGVKSLMMKVEALTMNQKASDARDYNRRKRKSSYFAFDILPVPNSEGQTKPANLNQIKSLPELEKLSEEELLAWCRHYGINTEKLDMKGKRDKLLDAFFEKPLE